MIKMSKLPRVDLHIHSILSDGEGDWPEIIETAGKKGLELIAITDHFDPGDPNNKNYFNGDPQSYTETIQQKLKDNTFSGYPFLLTGIETGPWMREGAPEFCEFVIGSVHYLPHYPRYRSIKKDLYNEDYWEEYKAAVLALAANPFVDILGHLEGYLPLTPLLDRPTSFDERREMEREVAKKYFDTLFWEKLIRRMVAKRKTLEIHGMSQTPRPQYIKMAVEAGVTVSIGSDAHQLIDIGRIDWCLEVLEFYGVGKAQLFTGRPPK
ncbi:MAG TPA: hypothetical protein DDZ91_11240 [Firmicutes bacterium]|nr:hypothetical protein [Bacillota bacterium]